MSTTSTRGSATRFGGRAVRRVQLERGSHLAGHLEVEVGDTHHVQASLAVGRQVTGADDRTRTDDADGSAAAGRNGRTVVELQREVERCAGRRHAVLASWAARISSVRRAASASACSTDFAPV